MSTKIDLPLSNPGGFPVWPLGGPKLFGRDIAAGGVARFKASSDSVAVLVPAGDDAAEVRVYVGEDAKTVSYEKAWADGVPMFPGALYPWGVVEGWHVALASEAGCPGVRAWGARELKG